ncbi:MULTISPECIES: LysM peptidoglycan-binding domain-containing protein [Moorena]|uniref:LysM domain protein n=1 Tax=Moorena producens 3L TaxID=489825 RepID=F4XIW7_9CYAN|nr:MULTISPECIES: LysM peptidoglycan-binding domain-containing protein [Moorena]EGJ35424.1 LysM domain protein [Moorena producens 3L]NEP68646.1 LysM peptidoglycan-binding domain-containing protein [Moorena sp. SIO3A5]NER90422.1 LysM peptidoglycan-binding domain-containing protein [Moorena sp. SIO3A2]OLT64886.1 peptidoglycan-binding protein LysM [Moorena producens 3L]
MALAKLTIIPLKWEKTQDTKYRAVESEDRANYPEITVLFNPESYAIKKGVSWSGSSQKEYNAPILDFGGGGSRELTLELLFDVSEGVRNSRLQNQNQNQNQNRLIDSTAIEDVREETNKLVALTRIQRVGGKEQPPPACKVYWGKAPTNSDFPFVGVITNLTQTFTLFKSDGKPIRAKVNITFSEYLNPEDDKRRTDPELTTRIVKSGETLSSIAADVYGNPKLWRLIAQENQLDNPRQLDIGKTLTIPKLL